MSTHARSSRVPLPFSSKQQMIQQAGKLGLIELVFTNATDKRLYAHHSYLMASSGVLRGILETQDDPEHPAKVARTVDSIDAASASATAVMPAIPLDEEDTETWELALALLYPSTMTKVAVTWKEVQPLLVLADKYDMPVIAERVKAFLVTPIQVSASGTQLKQGLRSDNVFSWFTAFSRRGWDDHVQQCIDFIVQNKLQLPNDYLVDGPQPKHIQQLYETIRKQYSATDSTLAAELGRTKVKTYPQAHCTNCHNGWCSLLLSNGRPAPICLWCGADKEDGYESDDIYDE